jgi:type IV pilus assembly protein PilM
MDLPFKNFSKMFSLESAHESGSVLGIDFGSSSIKIVQLKEDKGGPMLDTYGELQLGPYANVEIGRATNLEPSRLAAALGDIMTEAGVSSRSAGVAVPYASSFVTIINLPTQDRAQISAMIPIEARKYVPVPVTQVMLDWSVLPEKNGVETLRRTRVLLAAIHNEVLSRFKTTVDLAGVNSRFSEIEIFSTIRSVVERAGDSVMIVDIGAATTKLYVVVGGIVQATHSINVGGQDMTLTLAKALELSVQDAEEIKRQVGLNATDNPRIERALSFPLERLSIEARRFLEAYERTSGATPASSVILSGGGASLLGIDRYLHDITGRTVTKAHPFSKIAYPAFLEGTLRDIGPSFAVALGVALRRLSER